MDKFIEWLNAVAGRRVRLAEHLGIKPPVVSEWVTSKRSVPIVHAVSIERFTGGAITRRDLFPSSWGDIWPEMVTDEFPWPELASPQQAVQVEGQGS
jgi:DNA-binding transcriptional regulator YdaS (Cro superfamily)